VTYFGSSLGALELLQKERSKKSQILVALASSPKTALASTFFFLVLASEAVYICACFLGLLIKLVEKPQ